MAKWDLLQEGKFGLHSEINQWNSYQQTKIKTQDDLLNRYIFFFFTEFNILKKSHSKLGTEWINLIKDFYRKLIKKSYIVKKNFQKIARIIVSLAKSWHININNLKLILFIHILVTSNWKWKLKKYISKHEMFRNSFEKICGRRAH